MKKHIVIEGNAFYEVDEECLRRKECPGAKSARDFGRAPYLQNTKKDTKQRSGL